MSQEQKDEMLAKIAEAMEQAGGDPVKQATYLDALIDPADANACEGCQ